MKVTHSADSSTPYIDGRSLETGKTYRLVDAGKTIIERFGKPGDIFLAQSTGGGSDAERTADQAVNLATGATLYGLLSDTQKFVEVDAEVIVHGDR